MICSRRKIKIVGIGGTIGSGKTTVARYFKQWGASCVSADRIGKKIIPLIAPALELTFGETVKRGNQLSIPRLRQVAFSSKKNIRLLNRISHQVLISELLTRIRHHQSGIMVIDAALLFDWKDILKKVDYAILVTALKVRKEHRSMAKGIDKATFWRIIKLQKKERDMAKRADFMIRNNGTLAHLKKQCRQVYQEIRYGC
jgi:dephospho-CoA kinase